MTNRMVVLMGPARQDMVRIKDYLARRGYWRWKPAMPAMALAAREVARGQRIMTLPAGQCAAELLRKVPAGVTLVWVGSEAPSIHRQQHRECLGLVHAHFYDAPVSEIGRFYRELTAGRLDFAPGFGQRVYGLWSPQGNRPTVRQNSHHGSQELRWVKSERPFPVDYPVERDKGDDGIGPSGDK